MLYTTKFWKDAFERILGTVLATVAATVGADGSGLADLATEHYVAVIGGAAVTTLLKCVVAAGIGDGSAKLGATKPPA